MKNRILAAAITAALALTVAAGFSHTVKPDARGGHGEWPVSKSAK